MDCARTSTDCAERLWSVNASILGDEDDPDAENVFVGEDTTFARLVLRKRNTFFSKWCDDADSDSGSGGSDEADAAKSVLVPETDPTQDPETELTNVAKRPQQSDDRSGDDSVDRGGADGEVETNANPDSDLNNRPGGNNEPQAADTAPALDGPAGGGNDEGSEDEGSGDE